MVTVEVDVEVGIGGNEGRGQVVVKRDCFPLWQRKSSLMAEYSVLGHKVYCVRQYPWECTFL